MNCKKAAVAAYVLLAHTPILVLLSLPYILDFPHAPRTALTLSTTFIIILFSHGTRYLYPENLSFILLHMSEYMVSFAGISPSYVNEFAKDPFKTAWSPILFIIILVFLETTFWLLISIGYNNAGVYGDFHRKVDWDTMRGGLVSVLSIGKVSGSVVEGGEQGRTVVIESSFPPPYLASTNSVHPDFRTSKNQIDIESIV